MNISLKIDLTITQLAAQMDGNKQTDHYFFAHVPGEVGPVGMLVVGIEEAEPAAWISRVFVEADHRGKGIATSLLQSALDICKEKGRPYLSLTVKNDNENAQRLYKSLGFAPFMKGQEDYMQYIKAL